MHVSVLKKLNGREKVMVEVSFNDIHTYGEIVQENDLYFQKHSPETLLIYDANFVQFKRMPTLEEFKMVEKKLWDYHQKYGQNHLKFNFPEKTMIPKDLYMYLYFSGYLIGYIELYKIDPKCFPAIEEYPHIRIEPVTDENFAQFLLLQYEFDQEYGKEFAEQKRNLYEKQMNDPSTKHIIAFYKDILAGCATVFLGKETVEIDSLTVHKDFQQKGIASKLQKYIMDNYTNKTVILVVDGLDSPRKMYQKQNYLYVADRFEATKVFAENYKRKMKRSI